MLEQSTDSPSLDEIARILKASLDSDSVKVTSGQVTLTMNAQLKIERIELNGLDLDPEQRASLERDISDAVTRAMCEVAASTARSLEALQESPDVASLRDALQREVGKRTD